MSPQAWVRYWMAGWIIGPAVAVVGIADGDARLIFLGGVLTFVTFGMVAFWRQKAQATPPDTNDDSPAR